MKQTSNNNNPNLLKEILLILNELLENRYLILSYLSALSKMINVDSIRYLHKLLLDRYLMINSVTSSITELLTPEYIYEELNSTHLIINFYKTIHELEINTDTHNYELVHKLKYLVDMHTGIPIPVLKICDEYQEIIINLIDNETNIINYLNTIENQTNQLLNYKNIILEEMYHLHKE